MVTLWLIWLITILSESVQHNTLLTKHRSNCKLHYMFQLENRVKNNVSHQLYASMMSTSIMPTWGFKILHLVMTDHVIRAVIESTRISWYSTYWFINLHASYTRDYLTQVNCHFLIVEMSELQRINFNKGIYKLDFGKNNFISWIDHLKAITMKQSEYWFSIQNKCIHECMKLTWNWFHYSVFVAH